MFRCHPNRDVYLAQSREEVWAACEWKYIPFLERAPCAWILQSGYLSTAYACTRQPLAALVWSFHLWLRVLSGDHVGEKAERSKCLGSGSAQQGARCYAKDTHPPPSQSLVCIPGDKIKAGYKIFCEKCRLC